jgi:predicted trehalose synthase
MRRKPNYKLRLVAGLIPRLNYSSATQTGCTNDYGTISAERATREVGGLVRYISNRSIRAVLNGCCDTFGRDSAATAAFYCEPAFVVFPNQIMRLSSRADLQSFFD